MLHIVVIFRYKFFNKKNQNIKNNELIRCYALGKITTIRKNPILNYIQQTIKKKKNIANLISNNIVFVDGQQESVTLYS